MKTKRSLIALALMTVLSLSIVSPSAARENMPALGRDLPPASSPQHGPTDSAELGAFLDDLLGKEMAENHIAGAAVSVVKDGKLLFARGYGYADVEKGVRVDPDRTVFRIGSVTKTFTWTAVMQLVEQGKLDLNTDVNTYLDFHIPDTYPQPITLKHLMTHASGFEDILLESLVSDANQLVPARAWLIAHLAARVSPPGESVGYSNYNAMLAGYIVARVSNQPYDQYVQEHIFGPLGMAHSTARSPMPADLRADVSVGYTYQGDAFQAFPDYAVQPAHLPSGGVQASVTDMARFMIAHLQGGTIAEARILTQATAQQMLSTLYTPDPRLLGAAYGFFDWSDNGQRTLGHSGYEPPMNSVLLLLPDQNLGVFAVYNSKGAQGVLTTQHLGFQRAFFDHYYPPSAVKPVQPPADFAASADRFVGSYREISAAHTTIAKIAGFFGATEISNPGDGTLLLSLKGVGLRFVQVAPLYFQQVDGPYHLIFREDDKGRVTGMYTDLMPQYVTVKLDWYETPGFNMALLLGCLLVFLSVFPLALVRALWNRRLSGDRKRASPGARTALGIVLGISVLNLIFTLGLMQWVMQPSELHSPLLIFKIVLGLGVLSALLTIGALACSALAWKDRYWGSVFRVYYTLVTVAAVAFVWIMDYWNMLGWRY